MDGHQILSRLKSLANPKNVEGMARYGINPHNAHGVSMPTLRQMAKESGRDHDLALQLWDSGIHEAKILATLIDDPNWVTEALMEAWVLDFDSWDICSADGVSFCVVDERHDRGIDLATIPNSSE